LIYRLSFPHFVEKEFEISNHELIRDMDRIMKLDGKASDIDNC
jgi:hypothetical protein